MNSNTATFPHTFTTISLLVCVGLFAPILDAAPFDPKVVSLGDVIKETQRHIQHEQGFTLFWWIPREYWQVVFANSADVPAAQAQDFDRLLRPYVMVGFVDVKQGLLGSMSFKEFGEVKDSITATMPSGKRLRPIDESNLQPELANLLGFLRPILKNSMGQLGNNFHFFLFRDDAKSSAVAVDSFKEGRIKISCLEKEATFRLPLASLLPSLVCPKCAENMPGNFKFCPHDGTKLTGN